eukprot:CAMPEP_0119471710 /NCGR_PEP_ID=MMETSP1344-20130328/4066_1 /TAXON_ID=236787 /ORGANISM="Florenciella parvula, Strain CCMP2471" /LENGTH=36 /DNA_ID= /DNA_START= /DNA_END= /DNA_ORIENTATION=
MASVKQGGSAPAQNGRKRRGEHAQNELGRIGGKADA